MYIVSNLFHLKPSKGSILIHYWIFFHFIIKIQNSKYCSTKIECRVTEFHSFSIAIRIIVPMKSDHHIFITLDHSWHSNVHGQGSIAQSRNYGTMAFESAFMEILFRSSRCQLISRDWWQLWKKWLSIVIEFRHQLKKEFKEFDFL